MEVEEASKPAVEADAVAVVTQDPPPPPPPPPGPPPSTATEASENKLKSKSLVEEPLPPFPGGKKSYSMNAPELPFLWIPTTSTPCQQYPSNTQPIKTLFYFYQTLIDQQC